MIFQQLSPFFLVGYGADMSIYPLPGVERPRKIQPPHAAQTSKEQDLRQGVAGFHANILESHGKLTNRSIYLGGKFFPKMKYIETTTMNKTE